MLICARPSQSYFHLYNQHSHCTDGKLGVQRHSGNPARSQSWTVFCGASDTLSPSGVSQMQAPEPERPPLRPAALVE